MRLAVAYGGLCLVQAAAVTLPGRPLRLPAALRGPRLGARAARRARRIRDRAQRSTRRSRRRLAELAVVTPAARAAGAARRRAALAHRGGAASRCAPSCVGLSLAHGELGGLARAVTIACACAAARVAARRRSRRRAPCVLGLVALVVLDVILVVSGDVGTHLECAAPGGGARGPAELPGRDARVRRRWATATCSARRCSAPCSPARDGHADVAAAAGARVRARVRAAADGLHDAARDGAAARGPRSSVRQERRSM